ncbi:MAG: glycoside hydrolase family 16 protein [Bacteroidales bacterium]|nr:glycoside hydrolase family 16 protein [Bacteroidales bacterium]
MKHKTISIRLLTTLALLLPLISCNAEEGPENNGIPTYLQIIISHSENDPGSIKIEANARNAVKYELYVNSETDLAATNTTGTFEYTFSETGTYEIHIKAYGSSGKFITGKREVEIKFPVSVNQGFVTPLEYEGYELVWHDEFEGNALNINDWVYEVGDGCPNLCGWGNNELQYYRAQNASVSGSTLIIEARNETIQNKNYTSARIKTQGRQSFQYGRIDIRALLPVGQGIWPALWMLGNDITSVGWPKCGEIDIMEMIGGNGREKEVHGTVHFDNNGHQHTGGTYTLATGTFADEYHVFTIIWDEEYIRWFVNDNKFYEVDITPDHLSEFHQEFYLIFNLAVGGNWPGNPDSSTVFPQQMKVDYVRVFQKIN